MSPGLLELCMFSEGSYFQRKLSSGTRRNLRPFRDLHGSKSGTEAEATFCQGSRIGDADVEVDATPGRGVIMDHLTSIKKFLDAIRLGTPVEVTLEDGPPSVSRLLPKNLNQTRMPVKLN